MRRNKKLTLMLVLVILVMSLTVGYAVLSTNLNINGTSTIGNARWDIHFENIQNVSGSVTPATAATINSAKDTVTYVVNLSKPGDFYEFTVDIRNAGTIDGMIESITSKINNQPISNKPVYLDYYVTYNDGIEIENNQLLTAGTSEKIKVHVGFSTDISADDLPGTSQTYSLSLNIKETQATSAAEARPYFVYTNSMVVEGWDITDSNNNIVVYDNYSTATNLSGLPVFIKALVNNNIVEKVYIGFINNNHDYYIEGYLPTAADADRNIAIASSAFGSSNCDIVDNSYHCSSGPLELFINQGYMGAAYNDANAAYCITMGDIAGCYMNLP